MNVIHRYWWDYSGGSAVARLYCTDEETVPSRSRARYFVSYVTCRECRAHGHALKRYPGAPAPERSEATQRPAGVRP